MPTITPTNLRPPIQVHSNLYLSILQPATLLSALVNNVSIARGARAIAYDTGTGSAAGYTVVSNAVTAGVSDNIGTSLMLEVDTATGTEIVRVKSITGNQVSGTVTVAENAISFADDQVIRIRHFFQIAPVPPAIRSGIFYKDYDISFVTGYATQPNPVAIIGPPLAGFLSASSIAFSLNSSSSYAIASGATISSRVWACVHNGGGTAGITFSSTTAANPTLTITQADTYWLSCQVTDSNSKTQTTYRPVFVYSTASPPYTDFTIQSLNGDWDSGQWRLSANLTGDLTLTDIPDGTLAVVWYQNYFNGVEGYVNVWSPFGNNIIYCGYMWSDSDQDDFSAGTGQATFEVISPITYLDAITDYGTVSLEAKTSPAIWSDYASWLSVGRAIHHLLKWDTTILEVVDVLGLTDNTYGVKVCEFTEDTLLQRINGLANDRGIHAKLVSSRLGRLHLVQDSQMLDTTARAALDTVFSITTNDISGGINVTRNETDVRAFADLDGFGYSHPTSTAIISMIPGYQEGGTSYNLPEFRGTGIELKKSQVLDPAGAQTDANERVGRMLALANVSPKEIRFACRGNYLGAFEIVPSVGWYQWNITDATLKRELPLNTILTVCRSVAHTPIYESNIFTGFIQTSEVVLQPEAEGPDGIPGNYPTTYPAITTQQPVWDEPAFNPITPGLAYFQGGYTGGYVTTSDRLTFATGVTADHNDSDLTVALAAPGGVSDRVTYAYTAGGAAGGPYYDETNRLVLATGVNAAYSEILTIEKESMYSLANPANGYGYYAGGVNNTNSSVNDTDRQNFSTGAIADFPTGDLSGNRSSGNGFNGGGSYGYFCGGSSGAGNYQATCDRMTLSSGIVANYPTGDLVDSRIYAATVVDSGNGYAYLAGGEDGGGAKATAERMTLSTGVFALNAVSNLSAARSALAGASDGSTYGYFVGGGLVVTTDRITYSTGVTAANAVSNLTAAKSFFPGISDGSLA